jgi:hypothetical protein
MKSYPKIYFSPRQVAKSFVLGKAHISITRQNFGNSAFGVSGREKYTGHKLSDRRVGGWLQGFSRGLEYTTSKKTHRRQQKTPETPGAFCRIFLSAA